jgi:hypothetical protein
MGKAFFVFNASSNDVQERDDKIIPDPVVLGNTEIILDGKKTLITATSGVEQYVIVEPGDYPENEQERQARRGATRG